MVLHTIVGNVARRLHLPTRTVKYLVRFTLTMEHSGGLAVALEFISRATFHWSHATLASVVGIIAVVVWFAGPEAAE